MLLSRLVMVSACCSTFCWPAMSSSFSLATSSSARDPLSSSVAFFLSSLIRALSAAISSWMPCKMLLFVAMTPSFSFTLDCRSLFAPSRDATWSWS